jgi:hypothetical protein
VRDIDTLNELLKKYDLVLPVLPREQRKIYRSKRKTLARILGKDEKSSLMLNAAVRFYYMMRNMGMRATLASGARAAVFASVFAVIIVASGSVLLLQNYIYNQGVIAVNDSDNKGFISAAADLKIVRNGTELITHRVAEPLIQGDEIITGDSSALFQFPNGAVVKVLKRSTVKAVSLGSQFRLDVVYGGALTRIPAMADGSGYTVHTMDSVITVKGTEFGATYADGKTSVFVTEGAVVVKHLPSGREYDVTAGNSSVVSGDGEITPLDSGHLLIMKGFADLTYVESLSTKSTSEMQEILDKLKASDDTKGDETPQSKRMTLEELKTKYGKLDEVMLYSGRKFTGVIISRGSIYKILTPAGTISVPAKEVKGSKIVQ